MTVPIYSHFISGQNGLSLCKVWFQWVPSRKKIFFLCLNFVVPNNWLDGNFYFYSVWLCRNPVIVYICGWKYIYFYIAVFSNSVESHSLLKTSQYVLFGSSRRKNISLILAVIPIYIGKLKFNELHLKVYFVSIDGYKKSRIN